MGSDFPSSIEKKKYEKRKKEDEQNESQLYTQKKISLSCLFRFLIYFLVYGSDEFHRANRTKFIFLNRSKNTFIKNIIKQNKGNPKKSRKMKQKRLDCLQKKKKKKKKKKNIFLKKKKKKKKKKK